MTTRAGVVLAGGFATRFDGGDKTLAELDGRPLLRHVVDALEPVVEDVVISCREEQVERFREVLQDVSFRPDPTPDQGPLAGLAAALDDVTAEQVAVTTADRPLVPPGLYRTLFDRIRGDGVVVQTGEYQQPAPAVFRTQALSSAVRRLRTDGERRLTAVLDVLDLDTVDKSTVTERWGADVLTDVNTRGDLDALRS